MSLKKNIIYNTIYQIFTIILPLITVPYISRVLGPEGQGQYSYTSAYSQYFIILGMIGISLYGNRQIAYVRDDKNKLSKEFINIYTLQVITTVISLIIYLIIFVGVNKNNKVLYAVESFAILATILDISWFFIGYGEMKSVVVRNTITKVIGVILTFVFVKESTDVILYAGIIGGTALAGQLIMWTGLKGKIIFIKPSFKYAFNHLRPALALFVSQLAIQVYTLLDRTMLGILTTDAQVGLYDNSQKTIKLLVTLASSLGVVMLPKMSELFAKGKDKEFKELIYKVFRIVNFISIPMAFGLLSIANSFSLWFYSSKFDGISILLKVGGFIVIAIGWSNILGIQVMLPMKKEKEFTISVTIGAVTNFILNLILIFKFKSLGTTIASVAAEFAVTFAQLYYLRNVIDFKKVMKTVYKPLLGSIAMLIAVSICSIRLPINILGTLIQVVVGVIVYGITMILLKDETIKFIFQEVVEKFLKRR